MSLKASAPAMRSSDGSFPKGPTAKQQRDKRRRELKANLIAWHKAIVERARTSDGRYLCFHCGNPFAKNELCGDHFPYSRGSRKDLILDPNNGVASCKDCNRSDSPKRRQSIINYWKAHPYPGENLTEGELGFGEIAVHEPDYEREEQATNVNQM